MVKKRWELCGVQKRKKAWREAIGEIWVVKSAIREREKEAWSELPEKIEEEGDDVWTALVTALALTAGG